MVNPMIQINDKNRLNPIFFYGLYMDADRLRSMGVKPRMPLTGHLNGYKVRLGRRGSLLRCAGGITWGLVFHLTHAEISRLYPEAGLTDYVPEAVTVNLANGESIAALSYITLNPAREDELNLAYVLKLADLLMELKLPYAQLADQVEFVEPRRINFESDALYQEELTAYNRLLRADFLQYF